MRLAHKKKRKRGRRWDSNWKL